MQEIHPLKLIDFHQDKQAYVIEASAGTGKTWTIERLYIKALLEANSVSSSSKALGVNNILVVTFTKDATEELKQRISAQIQLTINQIIYLAKHDESTEEVINDDIFLAYLAQKLAASDVRTELARKYLTVLTRALQNFDQAAIYTIHAFCNHLLQDYQFECKVNSDFTLVADRSALKLELVRNFMRSQIINNPAFNNKLGQILSNLERLFESGKDKQELIERINNKLPKDLLLRENDTYLAKYQLAAGTSFSLLMQDELNVDEGREAKAAFLSVLIAYIVKHYMSTASFSNDISYDELIQIVASSLANNFKFATKVFLRYPIAFIDEFQDTDLLQWQIFSTIYQLEGDKRGNVVVVGDPKQAIYRFRGADVDTYLAASAQIGQKLELSNNFRSKPTIMSFINQLFSLNNQSSTIDYSFLGNGINYTNIAAKSSAEFVVTTFEQLAQFQQNYNLPRQQLYSQAVQLVVIKGKNKEEREQQLLSALTFEILALLKQDPSLTSKIAILVSKNTEAELIVKQLRKYGVKASALKLGNIFAQDTAQHLYQLLVALSDLTKADKIRQALSSPLFNLDLLSFALDEQGKLTKELEYWYKQLFNYKQIWQDDGVIGLVYTLLNDLSQRSSDAKGLNNRQLANLWQLAELLNKQAQYLANQEELIYWFKQKITDTKKQLSEDLNGSSEELVRLDNDEEQITIMTQHSAKGLESEILFCPYFKAEVKLDDPYDFNYRRPFFASYRDELNSPKSALIMDQCLANRLVANDNKEIHRLNYVALTRAKSRIYIYLKQMTITKAGKYYTSSKPDKVYELFGYVASNPKDTTHPLFSFPEFFGDNPMHAIKDLSLFEDVIAYNREVSKEELNSLRHTELLKPSYAEHFKVMSSILNLGPAWFRQSYSRLAEAGTALVANEYYVPNEVAPEELPSYRYSILHDKQLTGAVFGTLFHSLCENYPFSEIQLQQLLHKSNINYKDNDYVAQLMGMLTEAFNYPLLQTRALNDFSVKLHELEFNLHVVNSVSLVNQVAKLIANYFGQEHPFSLAVLELKTIEVGFLVGFIDLVFEEQGKYWVLDYKTNSLANYAAASDCLVLENPLIDSMAEHHYYLQYLLYLVALKRYLEQRLQIPDATALIGGAVYFYVRGIYTTTVKPHDGVYLDLAPQQLVRSIDLLLQGKADGA